MPIFNIHEYDDYKVIINAFLESSPKRGAQSKIADSCSINRPYFSNVMKSEIDFTLEQGVKIADYMKLSRYEKDYFISLLLLARSGNEELRNYFQDEVEIKKRNISPEYRRVQKYISHDNINNSQVYSSCWLFEIVETFLKIPKYRKLESLRKKLNINESLLNDIMKTLEENDIVSCNDDVWTLKEGWDRGKVINDVLGVVSHCKQFRDLAMIRASQTQKGEKMYMSTLNVPLSTSEIELLFKKSEKFLTDTVLLGKSDKEKEDVWVVNLDIFPPGYPD